MCLKDFTIFTQKIKQHVNLNHIYHNEVEISSYGCPQNNSIKINRQEDECVRGKNVTTS